MNASIRPATLADEQAVERLAGRDSAPVPTGRLLLAEEDRELRAAIDLDSGAVVADPFTPTAHLVAALRAVAAPRTRPHHRARGRLPQPQG